MFNKARSDWDVIRSEIINYIIKFIDRNGWHRGRTEET